MAYPENAYIYATFATWAPRVVQLQRRYDNGFFLTDADGYQTMDRVISTRPATEDEIAAYEKKRDHIDAVREMDRRDRRMGRAV